MSDATEHAFMPAPRDTSALPADLARPRGTRRERWAVVGIAVLGLALLAGVAVGIYGLTLV